MCKLSIIIPVYNIEEYVDKTLSSVYSTEATDFEVIVINDGTQDRSMDVVRKYASQPNLIILEQDNKGLSAARNLGIDHAAGEYVWFVDGDDMLVEDGVGKVLRILADHSDIDILAFPLIRWNPDKPSQNKLDLKIDRSQEMSGKEAIRQSILPYFGWVQRYVFLRSWVISNYWLRFPMGVQHEDTYFGTVAMYLAHRVHFLTEPVYIYRTTRPGSIMSVPTVERSWSRVEVYRRLMVFMQKNVDPNDRHCFHTLCFNNLVYCYDRQLYGDNTFRFFVKNNADYLYQQWRLIHPEASVITRIGRRLFYSAPNLYDKLKRSGR